MGGHRGPHFADGTHGWKIRPRFRSSLIFLPEFSSSEVMTLVQEMQSPFFSPAPGLGVVSGGWTPERAVYKERWETCIRRRQSTNRSGFTRSCQRFYNETPQYDSDATVRATSEFREIKKPPLIRGCECFEISWKAFSELSSSYMYNLL